jgi:D-alanine-D-alanine ligase
LLAYDYEDKYLSDRARLLAPAELEPEVAERVRAMAVQAFAAIGGTGMARVDFFLEDGETLYWSACSWSSPSPS